MITAPQVSAGALNIYIIFVQMTDRVGWGKVKCYFCCKNLVSQSKITHLVTLHRTANDDLLSSTANHSSQKKK